MSADSAKTGESVSSGISKAANVGKGATAAIAPFVPEDKKPWLNLANGILGSIAAVSASAAAFFRKRKQSAERMAEAGIIAAERSKDGGATISAAAKELGIADAVEAKYQAMRADGIS